MAVPGAFIDIYFDTGIQSVYCYNSKTSRTITISGDSFKINYGDSLQFTITLKDGYEIDTMTFGGQSITENPFDSGAISSDSTLTITSKLASTTSRKSVDLTTLSGWSALSAGSHIITIIAKANGYINSAESASVTVTKQQTTPTEPTEDTLAGTWTLNSVLNLSADEMPEEIRSVGGWPELSFIVEETGEECIGLGLGGFNEGENRFTTLLYGDREVYNSDAGWEYGQEATINITTTLEETTNGEYLIDFFVRLNNATRKSNISFTIAGTPYQAVDGMTWAQWVDSPYNIDNYINAETWIGDTFGTEVRTVSGVIVRPSDTIQDSTDYMLGSGGTAN